ncbi:hypothetical protein [Legionella drancourtii]|uniref:Polymer-forming cytoskeletal protein n=1 Tax=Legionella drancourtii LLAP12 TaxID=658187 RepID=G9EIX3_9GAMM|nr:hypothetical protein [Legionella drancourtii]EHL32891.1 hypothetical protein LDG_5130 [Legionella drancourtii LLAP12]
MSLKKIASAVMMVGAVSMANAEVCKETPGSITCGKGTVKSLAGNGMVSVNGTTIEGATVINGMLTADDASFSSLNVNGSVSLMQCTVSSGAEIKGSLKASSAKFESSLDIYSSSTRFVNSKANGNLNIRHIDDLKQEVFLDNNSEVGGDIVFDDGHGKVYVSGGSKIGGSVIGGEVINK